MERVLLSVSILEFVSCKISGGSGNDFDGMLMRCLGNKSQPGEVFFLFALGPPSPPPNVILLCMTDGLVSDSGTPTRDYSPGQQCQRAVPDITIQVYFIVSSWHGKMFFCFDYIS